MSDPITPQNEPTLEQILEWISTEIGAGKSFTSDDASRIWNNAHDRCLSIVQNYKDGFGLFQMTHRINNEAVASKAKQVRPTIHAERCARCPHGYMHHDFQLSPGKCSAILQTGDMCNCPGFLAKGTL